MAAWTGACIGADDGFAFQPAGCARWGGAGAGGAAVPGMRQQDALVGPWALGGGAGGHREGICAPRAWACGAGGMALGKDVPRFAGDAAAAAKGGGWSGCGCGGWEGEERLADCEMEGSLLACGAALMSTLAHGEAYGGIPGAPGRQLACSPVLSGGAMTADLGGRWDLVLGGGLAASFLGGRSDTLRSIATQGGQEEGPFLDAGDCDEGGTVQRRLDVSGDLDNSPTAALQGGEWFLSRSSWSSEDDLISVASSDEGLQQGREPRGLGACAADPHGLETGFGMGFGRMGGLEGDGDGLVGVQGAAVGGRAGQPSGVGPFRMASGMDLMQDGSEGGDRFGRHAGGGQEAQLSRGSGCLQRSSTVLTDRRPSHAMHGVLHVDDMPRPQFPSLTSVFGSCNGSNRAFRCMPGPGHRPHLPSLNSIFGTCGGSSCISSRQQPPPLPSLTSVFGSCNGRSAEGQACWHWCRGAGGDAGQCSVCLTVSSHPDLQEGLLIGESCRDAAAALGGRIASLDCLGCGPGREDQGCNSIRDEGCTMLREGADHPYFDAEWNLIPMLNELWGEEADDAPKKRATIKAKVLYQALKNVPLVPQQHVLTIRNLGEGSYGRVALGFCPGLGEIAVKWNKADDRPTNSLEFQHEAAMLATLNHPNVMGLLGLVTRSASEGEVVGFMTEYAPYGTLSAYVRRTRLVLPLKERLFLALQVARGMAFIHSCDAVHFDLKPDNVLVQRGHEQDPLLKVADLGLARWKVDGMVKAPGSLRGTLPYMAPELVCDVPLVSDKVDVWAFGCMLQEMATLEVPYSDMLSEEIVMGLMEGWLRPPIPMCEPEWQGLLEHCLAFAPQNRPSFEELSCRLAALHNAC